MKPLQVFRAIFLLLCIAISFTSYAGDPGKTFYNIKDYGAKGNGTTLDTKTINASIDAASQKAEEQFTFLPAII